MSMSPRLLRPRATGFDPRSISGLALWLDASSTGDLYTTDAGPVTAVSLPTEISGCVGWWDASDASTLFAANTGDTLATTTVGRWANKGTLGSAADLLQATSASRPTTAASTRNGRNVLSFDGTDDFLQRSFTLSQPCTVLMAFACPSTPGSNLTLIDGAGAGNKLRVFTSGSNLAMYSGAQLTSNILPSSLTAWGVRSFVFNGASSAAISGGLVDTAGNTGTTAADGLTVAAWGAGGSQFFGVTVAEIIVFNTALSTADRARVEAYLATRWGISGVHAPATATSDPVGYWRDRSGNNRHATQATAGNRPTVSASTQNSRRQVALSASTGNCLTVPSLTLDAPFSILAVVQKSSRGIATFAGSSDSTRMQFGDGSATFSGGYYACSRIAGAVLGSAPIATSRAQVFCGVASSGTLPASLSMFADGLGGVATTITAGTLPTNSLGNSLTVGSASSASWGGTICELLAYSKTLTTLERQRLESYLATRWGITLAPQVANPDAQDWVNRVYANGGTVSASTAAAVNTFAESIASAGLRDRFYRLNLFAGTGLNACLVPLYRGPSLGGTQYGNTTDTNVGPFVSGDFAETGASGGLLGNGTSKYLNTGLKADVLASADRHLSVTLDASTLTVARHAIGADNFGAAGNFYWGILSGTSASTVIVRAQSAAVNSSAVAVSGKPQVTLVGNGSALGYVNGSLAVTGPSGAFTPAALDVYVGGVNRNGTSADLFIGRVQAYSIGAAMTASQAAAYYTAMQAFQTAMTRNA